MKTEMLKPVVSKAAAGPLAQAKGTGAGWGGSEGDEHATKRMRHWRDGSASSVAPPIVREVLSSYGQPLDRETRSFMEPRFGHDFGRVRVHANERAAQSAESVSALAYTVGNHMVFGPGQYAPGTSQGRTLIAHELTHTIQQQQMNFAATEVEVESAGSAAETMARNYTSNLMVNRPQSPPARSAGLPTKTRIVNEDPFQGIAPHSATGNAVLQRQEGSQGKKGPDASTGGARNPSGTAVASRVHDIDVKNTSKPSSAEVKPDPENPGVLKLTTDSSLSYEVRALVKAPDDCRDISFGFIQLCRPYSLFRAVYRSLTGGDDLEVDPSAKIRAREPVLDVSNVGDIFYKKVPVICALPDPDKQMVALFSDRPAHFFKVSIDSDHYLAGVAAHDFFFTTLTVLLPGQPPQHLKSFYWDIKHCEGFGAPPPGSPPGTMGPTTLKTSAVGVGDFIDGAPGEPGITKMGLPADKICKDAVNSEITSSYSKPNKGKINFGC